MQSQRCAVQSIPKTLRGMNASFTAVKLSLDHRLFDTLADRLDPEDKHLDEDDALNTAEGVPLVPEDDLVRNVPHREPLD